MKLSEHFDLDELIYSDTAARRGIDNTPDEAVIGNLIILCDELLEPLRKALGPITVTSGYRSLALNRQIGSKDTSAHTKGLAADIRVKGYTPLEVCRYIAASSLQWHQLIHEGTWTHIAAAPAGVVPARQILTAKFVNGKARYSTGLPH